MRKSDSIAELAEIFRVAPSALRYWDGQGLIRFERNSGNNYRVPSFQTMLDICGVLWYRSMSVPLREIRQIPALDAESLRGLLDRNEEKILAEQEELSAALKKLRLQRGLLERMQSLKGKAPALVRCALPGVRPFSFQDEEAVQVYVNDSYRGAAVIENRGLGEPRYGVFVPRCGKNAHKQPDEEERSYLHGLLRIRAEGEPRHNGAEFARRAQALGKTPGLLLGRYLATVSDSGPCDFYEGYLELLE